jgi:hypothetical protein
LTKFPSNTPIQGLKISSKTILVTAIKK